MTGALLRGTGARAPTGLWCVMTSLEGAPVPANDGAVSDGAVSGRVLMLVWTGVSTDTRVLREARTLVDEGWSVHIIGRAVPSDFVAPQGISVSSVGVPPSAQGRTRKPV